MFPQGHIGGLLYPEEQHLLLNGPLCFPQQFQTKKVCAYLYFFFVHLLYLRLCLCLDKAIYIILLLDGAKHTLNNCFEFHCFKSDLDILLSSGDKTCRHKWNLCEIFVVFIDLYRERPVARSEQERPVLYLGPRPPDAASHYPASPRHRDGPALCLPGCSVGPWPPWPRSHPHPVTQLPYWHALDTTRSQPTWYVDFSTKELHQRIMCMLNLD